MFKRFKKAVKDFERKEALQKAEHDVAQSAVMYIREVDHPHPDLGNRALRLQWLREDVDALKKIRRDHA